MLRAHRLSVERTAEVLTALGLFRDDRVPAFETWLERSLAGLAPGIRDDVGHCLGGPRSRDIPVQLGEAVTGIDASNVGLLVKSILQPPGSACSPGYPIRGPAAGHGARLEAAPLHSRWRRVRRALI